jgi:HAMP domain-containing protein
MVLRAKFNLAILASFLVGFTATAALLKSHFKQNAREEAVETARVMMAAANSIRQYTTKEIAPLIGTGGESRFQSASVPAYAARAQFTVLQRSYPDYSYKEATLNPTNPINRTVDWEADIVNMFRKPKPPNEIVSERKTPTGPWLSLSHPISVDDKSCLTCHGVPSQAPASMVAAYGAANGFGWHVGEVIGAQIVSLPLAVPLTKARESLLFFLLLLTAVFLLMAVILNVVLHYAVVHPVKRMSSIATEVSLGHPAEEFTMSGTDEISALSAAFNRMRLSVEQAIQMLEGDDDEPDVDPEPSRAAARR